MSGYVDFGINPLTNDIAYENGKMKYVNLENETIQRVRTCLKRIQGEWFLDTNAGMPYFGGYMLGGKDFEYAKLLIRKEILSVEGVDSIIKMNLVVNSETKHVSVYAEIKIAENVYKLTEEI